MRAIGMLQEKLGTTLDFMHAKQCDAFWRIVAGALRGQRLWLTAIGRSLPGASSDKHRIKAVDRFLGKARVQEAVPKLYAALAAYLLRFVERPVILVDWTGGVSGFYVLSASLCFQGRALTLFSRTYPADQKCSPPTEREFLDELTTIVPSSCKPILVTDAGFLFKWFDCIQARGWDFIGRLRGKHLTLNFRGRWMSLRDVHGLAQGHARDLGCLHVGRTGLGVHRIVLSAKPKPKGRKKLGRLGHPRRSTADRQRRDAAREPWVLITSLADPAQAVVQAYRMRMQIEQTFRDLKNHRHGWSFEDVRSKAARRIDVLMLVGAFSAVAFHLVGLAVPERLQREFQANTLRKRRVFSTFFLGKLAVARDLECSLSARRLREAAQRLEALLHSVSLARLGAH